MAITRILAIGSLLALIGTVGVAPGYPAEPCCGWVGGEYINLKTGRAVLPPKDARSGSVENAKPQPEDVIIVIGPIPEPKRATNK
jgi:hypothetical protein